MQDVSSDAEMLTPYASRFDVARILSVDTITDAEKRKEELQLLGEYEMAILNYKRQGKTRLSELETRIDSVPLSPTMKQRLKNNLKRGYDDPGILDTLLSTISEARSILSIADGPNGATKTADGKLYVKSEKQSAELNERRVRVNNLVRTLQEQMLQLDKEGKAKIGELDALLGTPSDQENRSASMPSDHSGK